MLPLIGSLVGAGANLFGGLMGQQNQAAINQQNIQAQEAMNATNFQNQLALNAQNEANQELFAKSGIQWRVADAKAAGISPLAALGAQTASFSNNVGATGVAPKSEASNSFGTGIASAGQDISRAIQATRSPEEQAVAIEKTRQDLESGQLDNELKKAQLGSAVTRLRSAQVGPGIPQSMPSASVVVRNPDGSLSSGPSKTTEGWSWTDPLAKAQWFMGHDVPQWFGYSIPSEVRKTGSNYQNPLTGSYYHAPTMSDVWDTVRSVYGARSRNSAPYNPGNDPWR